MKIAVLLAGLLIPLAVRAWDTPGHRMVNQLALSALPADFPAFVRAPDNAERIAFLASEPDRWSHASELAASHANYGDHYLDLEQVPKAGLDIATLPSFRYDFVKAFAAGRAANASKFPPARAADTDHTDEWPGFVPWAITEHYGNLKAAFASLKAFEQAGSRSEVANAQANVVYLMGIMGHYVGDTAQPLHTTDHFNGWVGPNPQGYTADRGFHSWVDNGFIAKAGIKLADLSPRVVPAEPLRLAPRTDGRDPVFVAVFDYFLAQHQLVEPLYRLEKEGKLSRLETQPVVPEGRQFIERQLLRGGQMLASIWLSAWRNSTADTYLLGQLQKRAPSP